MRKTTLIRICSLGQLEKLLNKGWDCRVWKNGHLIGTVESICNTRGFDELIFKEETGGRFGFCIHYEDEFFYREDLAVFARKLSRSDDDMQKTFDNAEEVMATWPKWKKNSLAVSQMATSPVPRQPISND